MKTFYAYELGNQNHYNALHSAAQDNLTVNAMSVDGHTLTGSKLVDIVKRIIFRIVCLLAASGNRFLTSSNLEHVQFSGPMERKENEPASNGNTAVCLYVSSSQLSGKLL